MLWQDRLFLIPAWLLLSIPGLLVALPGAAGHSHETTFVLQILDRLFELTFLFAVGRRWLIRFKASPLSPLAGLRSYLLLMFTGFVFWLLFSIPLLVIIGSISIAVKSVFVFMLLPATLLALKFYMYFFPLTLGISNMREVLNMASGFLNTDRALPLRILAAPAGWSLLLAGLARLPSPDGRLPVLDGISVLCLASFWVFSTYLSIAAGLRCLDDLNWKRFALEPYRQARLTTLIVQAPGLAGRLLTPRSGLILMLIGGLVWLGNLQRLATLPPAAEIKLQKIEVSENRAILELEVTDPDYSLRGFVPLYFALAGQNREILSAYPVRATLKQSGTDALFGLPSSPGAVLELEFTTDRDQDSLLALEDAYLWYRHARITLLNFKGASVRPPSLPGS